ncbi:MAG: glycosyltransferase family 2 protein, partial [Burkholderiales bacterium]|nr:glycosyltransferase family 2 protein [Phycisphaerae bacterium]
EDALQFGPATRALNSYVVAPPIPDVATRMDWVSGASMMVRREVFEKVGLLDAGYFMYYEETDFCLRAARAGFECWYVPASRIIHLVGQSSGVTGAKRSTKRRPKYWFESRARYFRNNRGALSMHAANLTWLTAYPIGRAWLRLRGRRRDDPPMLWWDFLKYNYLPCK